jgi:hypothetical protein
LDSGINIPNACSADHRLKGAIVGRYNPGTEDDTLSFLLPSFAGGKPLNYQILLSIN